MPGVIEPLNPADDDAIAETHAVHWAAESYGRPRSDAAGLEAFRVGLQSTDGADRWRGWGIRAVGQLVGVSRLRWSTLDNLDLCWGWVAVLPEQRRRGYGSALLDTVADAARTLGRSRLELDAIEPVGAVDQPSKAFLSARGLVPVMHEQRGELCLPLPPGRLDELAAGVPEELSYAVETWRDTTPAHRSAAFRAVMGLVEVESPHGDREVEPTVWTEKRLREAEQRRASGRFATWTTAAFAPSGECAGFTELVAIGDDLTARQGGTLVTDTHRGQRLGLALKLANLRVMLADRPDLTAVTTYTSPENAHMNRVNDALGFAQIEALDLWSLDLARR